MGSSTCFRSTCTVLVALVALLSGLLIRFSLKPPNVVIHLKERRSHHDWASPLTLSDEQTAAYQRDGVLFAPRLLSPDDASVLKDAAEKAAARSYSILDLFRHLYGKVAFDLWRTDETCAQLSLQVLPPVASQLLSTSKFRLLRDAYFRYDSGGKGCGWHVDDPGFWPATEDTSGLTIWIALDEMKVSEGGGLAVANMSLAAAAAIDEAKHDWIAQCRQEIKTKGTCDMETKSPECHALLEKIKVEWDMQPGDAILWDRWTFHRGMPAIRSNGENNKPKRRYSVRYMPSNAKAFGAVHHSVSQGSLFDSPYYPQVWPELIDEEVKALESGLDGDLAPLNILRVVRLVMVRKMSELFQHK